MGNTNWIKLATDIPDHRKIKRIRKMPDGNNIILFWVFLLARAGESNHSGGLYMTDTLPYDVDDLAADFDFTSEFVEFGLLTLEKYGMVTRYDEIIFIKNWEEYQSVESLDKIREQNRIRQQRFKEKQKIIAQGNVIGNVSGNGEVTQGNATDIDKELDIELDKEKDKDNTANSPDGEKVTLQDRFNVIWALYPNKKGKDRAFTAYKKAVKDGTSDDEIVNGINAYKKEIEIKNTDQAYILHGSTYFNGKRWTDVYVDKPTIKKSFGYERTEEEEEYPF